MRRWAFIGMLLAATPAGAQQYSSGLGKLSVTSSNGTSHTMQSWADNVLQGGGVSHIGLVSTRNSVNMSLLANASSFSVRNAVWARTNMVDVAVILSNWYVKLQTTAISEEVGSGGPATFQVWVEYPAGKFLPMTFNHQPTGTTPDNTNITTDLERINIPKGAEFWINIDGTFASGTLPYSVKYASSDDMLYGNTPYTTPIGPAGVSTGATYYQLGVIGHTTQPAVCNHNDSRVWGATHDTVGTFDQGETDRSIGSRLAYVDLGVPSDTLTHTSVVYTNREQMEPYCTGDELELGVNDMYALAVSATALLALDKTFIAAVAPTHPWVMNTIPPETTSSDSWATVTNQSLNTAQAAGNAIRLVYNADLLNGSMGTSIVGVWDLSSAVSDPATGYWIANGSVDGVHETFLSQFKEQQVEPLDAFYGNQ